MTLKLSSGNAIPLLGFGTGTQWYKGRHDGPLDDKLIASLKKVLSFGYNHLDGAELYGTERELGIAVRESGLSRSSIFVTTKLQDDVKDSIADPVRALQQSLQRLGLDYVDLYLLHTPFFQDQGVTLEQAWSAMEDAYNRGLAKSIGVSNFRISDIQKLLQISKVKPSVNQIEYHPYLQQEELVRLCQDNGIVVAAYAPLASVAYKPDGPVDAVVDGLATKYSKEPANIILNWILQKNMVAITTSKQPERQKKALEVYDFALTPEEVAAIDAAGKQKKVRLFWTNKDFQDA